MTVGVAVAALNRQPATFFQKDGDIAPQRDETFEAEDVKKVEN